MRAREEAERQLQAEAEAARQAQGELGEAEAALREAEVALNAKGMELLREKECAFRAQEESEGREARLREALQEKDGALKRVLPSIRQKDKEVLTERAERSATARPEQNTRPALCGAHS